jgi:hypothetical protein
MVPAGIVAEDADLAMQHLVEISDGGHCAPGCRLPWPAWRLNRLNMRFYNLTEGT